MKKSIYFVGLTMIAGSLFTGCQDSYEDVSDHNNIWNPASNPVSLVLLDGKNDVMTQSMSVTLAQPVDYTINVRYAVAPERVEVYNSIYGEEAIILPSANYSFKDTQVTIGAGAVNSSSTQITFIDLLSLDDSLTYVLPVAIEEANIGILASRDVTYYVFRGAALINVVGNMKGTCLRFVNEGQTPMLEGLTQMTFECLIYPNEFSNMLSTLIGIEGNFLFRIGDAGIPSNQLQIATSNGNVTNSAWAFETGKWTFLTVTVDLEAHEVKVYFNGVQKGATESIGYNGPINWNVVSFDRACYIGFAYSTDRDFMGDMSEFRVWNKILTPADINARNHFYRVDTDSEGLVAYWKFDEGAGNTVHDYANGYDMYVPAEWPDTGSHSSVPGDIKWESVTLPAN